MKQFKNCLHLTTTLIIIDQACFFDEEQEKKDKYKMLALLEKLKKRLYEINDGSFEIDDRENERVKNL